MAGCLKQVDAAQKFLRGIRALPGYSDFAEKQAGGIKKYLEKLQEVTPGEAASILDRIDDALWTASQVEAFRESLACKTRAVVEENSRTTQLQEFTSLPYFLPDDLTGKILATGHDKDQLLFQLCAHAAKLSLRTATEASKATIIALAYWTQLGKGMSPKEKYNLYVKKKPLVTKYLSLPAPQKVLASLPMAWDDLSTDMKENAFPKGKPEANKELAAEVMQFVRNMPLRKDHSLLQTVSDLGSSSSTETLGASMSVDAICKVVEACSRGLQHGGPSHGASSAPQLPTMAAAAPKKKLLALEDGSVEDVEPTGFQGQQEILKAEGQKEPEMSVEQQLQTLQATANEMAEAAMKRPASKKGFKRPAAAVEVATPTQAVAMKAAGSTGSAKGTAKAVAKGKAKTKAKPKAKAMATVSIFSREEIRQSILKKVPASLKRLYKNGCEKCRGDMGKEKKNKKDKDDEEKSQYSYFTEEEDAVKNEEPAEEPPVRPRLTMTASKSKAAPTSPGTSSERAPRARSKARSPFSPPREEPPRTWKASNVKAERPSSPTRTRGKSMAPAVLTPPPVPESTRSRRKRAEDEAPEDERHEPDEGNKGEGKGGAGHEPSAGEKGTGKGYNDQHESYGDWKGYGYYGESYHEPHEGYWGRNRDGARWRAPTVVCLYCKREVSETRGSSGLSQHMWFSESCIQHQLWHQGGYTWHQAGLRAATLKATRENESFHEKGPMSPELAVVPARSAAHRMALDEKHERRSVAKEKKEDKEKKRRRRHRRPSPSPDPRHERRHRRKPPSDSGDERDGKATGREETVWIQVSRASLQKAR
eukprot:s2323_g19.t1